MKVALSLLSVAIVIALSEAEFQKENTRNCVVEYFMGCKISKGECMCGEAKGCTNTFPYKDLEECEKDIKGENDPCRKNLCKHGICVQTWRDGARSYRCDCAASNYYGAHCQHSCSEVEPGQEDFPAECIEIF